MSDELKQAANWRLVPIDPTPLMCAAMRTKIAEGWSDSMVWLAALESAPVFKPRFPETFCSQCGASLGPGNEGVSSCKDHK